MRHLPFIILLACTQVALGQDTAPTKTAAHLFQLGLGADLPGGDLADRFAWSNKVSGGYSYLTNNDWTLGADVSFHYGDNVQEDVLAVYRGNGGLLLTAGESFTNVILRQRGLYLGGQVGRLFALPRYYRSGIHASLGAGVMQHQIRIVDNSQNVVKLAGIRKQGYDRLTRGFALRQYIGFQHLSSNRRINYSIGIEFTQGFTSGVRSVDWDTGLASQTGRLDLMVGLKAVWILPFWSGVSNEDVFY